MTLGIGGAGCKIAAKLDSEAILVNVSQTELDKVPGGSRRIIPGLRSERGQFKGARKDPRLGHDAYQSVRRELNALVKGNKVFSSTGGGTGTGIVSGILEDLTRLDNIETEDRTFFGLVLPYAELESDEFVKNTSTFVSGPLATAIESGVTGNVVLFSNKKKFKEKIGEDKYNDELVKSLKVLLAVPDKNVELKLLEGHIDPEDFALFLAKPYFNHFCYFNYDASKSFAEQLEANANPYLIEPEAAIEAMFLLEVPSNDNSGAYPNGFYEIVKCFDSMGVSPIYSVVENPAIDKPFITVSLLYSRLPKELVADMNKIAQEHAQTKVNKTLEQNVSLDKLEVNLESQARTAAKKRGDEDDVLAVLKRIGKL